MCSRMYENVCNIHEHLSQMQMIQVNISNLCCNIIKAGARLVCIISVEQRIIGLVRPIQILNAYTNRRNARSKKRSLLVNN